MSADRPEFYEWQGEWIDYATTDYWCPSESNWSMCPGPCPDGTPHGPERRQIVKAKKMVYVGPGVS